jgi:hypothetical protein
VLQLTRQPNRVAAESGGRHLDRAEERLRDEVTDRPTTGLGENFGEEHVASVV